MLSLLRSALYGSVHAPQRAPPVCDHSDVSSSSTSSLASIGHAGGTVAPPGLGAANSSNELPNNQYQAQVHDPVALGQQASPEVPARPSRPRLKIPKLPRYKAIPQRHHHGVDFYHRWIIPSATTDDVMLVVRRGNMDRWKGRLYQISNRRTKPIEVIVSGDRHGEFEYIGSFMPTAQWAPFRRDIIGDAPELYNHCAKIADSHRTDVLREELARPTNDFVFCILVSYGFNARFCAPLVDATARGGRSAGRRARKVHGFHPY